MVSAKLIVLDEGLEAQFRLVPDDDEREEGEIDDDDDDDDDVDNDNEEKGQEEGEEEQQQEEEEEGDQTDGVGQKERREHVTKEDNNDNDRGAKADSKNEASHNNNHNDEAAADSESKNDNKRRHENDVSDQLSEPKVKKPKTKGPPRISLFEMQSFLVALILPEPRLSKPPSWCRVKRCLRASNVGIFLLDNVDLEWIPNKGSKFTHAFRFQESPDWIEHLTSVPLSRRLQSQTSTSEQGSSYRSRGHQLSLNAEPKISKTSLLLSHLQMLVEGYPMPMDEGIYTWRSKFSAVDERSRMFAIDCEMCITDRSELTRLSIVDEEFRVVYNELIKPDRPITNYLTRYSGITRQMMEGVTTTIEDVHDFMRGNIPRNAIFCGHSLNMDLAAMQIYHPYVIDTSVIYNRTGSRQHKPSLKSLAYEYLGKDIQSSDKLGHDSLEDAVTSMELVKLKMVNGLLFGDSVAFEQSQGIKYDSKTGITHLHFNKFIDRHEVVPLAYRTLDTTPGARCLFVHDKQEPLDQDVKDAIMYLLEKPNSICVILTNVGECYVKI